jgi:MMP 1-O-methyltransferase
MNAFAEHAAIIERTEGTTSVAEAQLLFELASQCRDGCIVEVGSYRGRSAVALALGTQNGADLPVYAIDPHEEFVGVLGGRFGPEDRGAFYRHMLSTGCYRSVRLVNLPSRVVAPQWELPVGLLWIDGDHSYEGVRSDFDLWAPHLTRNAVVAFDDAANQNIGPYRVVQELVASGGYRLLRDGKLSVLELTA